MFSSVKGKYSKLPNKQYHHHCSDGGLEDQDGHSLATYAYDIFGLHPGKLIPDWADELMVARVGFMYGELSNLDKAPALLNGGTPHGQAAV